MQKSMLCIVVIFFFHLNQNLKKKISKFQLFNPPSFLWTLIFCPIFSKNSSYHHDGKCFTQIWKVTPPVTHNDGKCFEDSRTTTQSDDGVWYGTVAPPLAERRESLTTKFAIQTFKNERHKDFFEIKSNIRHCSRLKPIIQEHTCNTERLKNSAIPFMTRILNKMKLEIPNDSS